MASRLYTDCFVKIFEFLRGDTTSLHAAALVNKSWCQHAVPIMWENTLDEKTLMSRNGKQKGSGIIDTYVSCLSQESRNALKMEKVSLPTVTRRPTFPYASYLRSLDLKCFYIAVQSWIENCSVLRRRGLSSDQIRLILQELLQQIFTLSPRMNALKINVDIIGAIVADILHRVPKANKCLAHLKEFMYFAEHHTMEMLFSKIAQSTGQIEQLDLSVYDRTAELINMLRAQKNLKVLIITNRTNSPSGFKFWVDTDAGTVISEKARTVTYLEIQKIHFPFYDLGRFENLINLNLLYSGSYSFQDWAPLADVHLRNLEKISYQNRHSLYLDIFGKFVENSGKNLTHITIRCCTICDPDKSHNLITSIADYCPNLLHYGGPIGANNASELGQLLNACSHIQSLELHPSIDNCKSAASPIDFNPIFRKIALKQPWELRELSVIHGWKFSAEVLENFIESRQRISKKVSVFWNECEITGNLDKICQKYQKNGILDKYGKIKANKY
ncbi:14426_t:CDS:1 [Acaulospora morrowiae]|uniref:14426_t:CDS:1 n=1 Tax=Acaulospora morrowiae TaxID=94023 RepID=A0A9N9C9S2_9GLOM|nr:14426_t:CDS:1 [Acaulospora morrowiae]